MMIMRAPFKRAAATTHAAHGTPPHLALARRTLEGARRFGLGRQAVGSCLASNGRGGK